MLLEEKHLSSGFQDSTGKEVNDGRSPLAPVFDGQWKAAILRKYGTGIISILAKYTSTKDVEASTPTSEGVNMDVRLHRASKAAALTLMILLITVLVSQWLKNPPPPITWEMDGRVSYSDAIFDIEIPSSFNITYNAEVDDFENTTRINVEINTELIMTRGLLTFEMISTYITPHSWYGIADSREAILSSSSTSVYWNRTSFASGPFGGVMFKGSNETIDLNRTLPGS